MCKVVKPDAMFSLPRSLANFTSVEESLATPATKRQRTGHTLDDSDDLQVDDGAGTELQPTMFFNLVLKNPEKKKRVRPAVGAAGQISSGTIVVAVREQRQPACSDLAVLKGYSCRSNVSSNAVVFLDGLKGAQSSDVVDAYEAGWLQWQASGVEWFIEGVSAALEDVSRVASSLMRANAFPGEHSPVGYLPLAEDVPVLEKFAQLGFAELQGQRWMLTREGMARMRCDNRVCAPSKVFAVRDNLALADRTPFECLMLLNKEGWEWRPKLSKQIADAYAPGSDKYFYTTQVPSHAYLRALLSADDLFASGLAAIPHGRADAVYVKALKGDFGVFEQGSRDPLALTFDGPSAPPPPLALCDEDEVDDLPEGFEKDFEEAFEEWLIFDGAPDGGGEMEDEPVVPSPPVPPAAADPPPDAPDSVLSDAVAGQRLKSAWWGPFRFIPKQPGTLGLRYGSYSVVCPYHAKSKKTGCSLARTITGVTQWDREACIRRLMWWACQALDHSRQRSHLIAPSDVESCPPAAWLKAHKPDLPDGSLASDASTYRRRHDDELDHYNVPETIPPPTSWELCFEAEEEEKAQASVGQTQRGAPAKRRGRGSARGRGRGASASASAVASVTGSGTSTSSSQSSRSVSD